MSLVPQLAGGLPWWSLSFLCLLDQQGLHQASGAAPLSASCSSGLSWESPQALAGRPGTRKHTRTCGEQDPGCSSAWCRQQQQHCRPHLPVELKSMLAVTWHSLVGPQHHQHCRSMCTAAASARRSRSHPAHCPCSAQQSEVGGSIMQSVMASKLPERQRGEPAMCYQKAVIWWHAANLLDERVDDVSGMHINCDECCQHTP